MAGRRENYEKKLDALIALRGVPAAEAEGPLRKALGDSGGHFIAKAAAIAADHGLAALAPDLAATFTRLATAVDPARADPQCLAKSAIVKALHELGHRHPALYLQGVGYFQLEAVFGGKTDTAGALRGLCALALADADHPPRLVLNALTDLLLDPEKAARRDAVRAIARLAQPESPLLLRLKAQVGDADADVLRECLLSLMALAPAESTGLVARFLEPDAGGDDLLCADAAEALASARHPEALEALIAFLARPRIMTRTRRTVLLTMAASPLPAAADYLVKAIAEEPPEVAEAAVRALGASRFREEQRARAREAVDVRGQDELRRAFAAAFGDGRPL